MTATELLAAIRTSRLRGMTTCDLAVLCALAEAGGPIVGRAALARATTYHEITSSQSAASLALAGLIKVEISARPLPNTYTITALGHGTIHSILTAL